MDNNDIIVGIVQDAYTIDPQKNYEKIKSILTRQYKEADVILLPEYSMINILAGLEPQEVYSRSEPLEDSIFISKLSDLANFLDINIIAHIIERTDTRPKTKSTSVLIEPSGKIHRLYSKIHLFDAYGYRESDYFIPGDSLSKGIYLGKYLFYVAICFDLRFPELFRTYARNNAYGVFVHAGWVKGYLKEEVLDVLGRARSHENTMYIILSDHTGELYVGRSGIFNPYGFREVDIGFKPGYIEWTIKPEVVEEARKTIPVLDKSRMFWDISFKK
ncbi:MAG: carbon-nitrogen hydrolase family protein [Staphylothermus sp.]|nr:carbon-nitrogen hydrolase family protein [Staphylothermus sp.]